MINLDKIHLFRMIHIENIPHILRYGITHQSSIHANRNYLPIGDESLIATRKNFRLNNGRNLGEYIPFYFGVRMPMLYVIQKGFNMVSPTPPEEIVYCVTSVRQVLDAKLDFVFTDGHAIDRFSMQFGINDVHDIGNLLDMGAIRSKYWKEESDLDKKRRKEAEFLIYGDIPQHLILGFITRNEDAMHRLTAFGIDSERIIIRPDYYF